jgi:hypothetical protein
VGQQGGHVAHQRVGVDGFRAGQALPDMGGGQRQQREADQRDHDQRRLQARIELAARLRRHQRAGDQRGALHGHALHQPFAQLALDADDLADPQPREPRRGRRHPDQPPRETLDQRADIGWRPLAGGRGAAEDLIDQRQQPFLEHGFQQLLALAEVIVDQRRGHAGFGGDCLGRCGGYAMPGEQGYGRLDQAVALAGIGAGDGAPRAPGVRAGCGCWGWWLGRHGRGTSYRLNINFRIN